jgi:peptidyl-prolyl cis-trans isomerase C
MNMTPIRTALSLGLMTAVLAACGGQQGATPVNSIALVAPPEGALLASVNGEIVTEPLLQVFAGGRGLDIAKPDERKQALDSLIENILLAQDGIARGLTGKPEVQAELSLVRMQQLSGRALADFRSGLEVTDAQVEQYYRQEVERAGDREWLVEHILFADQAAAGVAISRALQPGIDFAEVMAEHQHTSMQARQLGWSNATQLPPEIVTAMHQLADGEVAPVAVQTRFGWHVVRRADSRPFEPPALEAVRDGARRHLQERAMAEHLEGLRARATIASGTAAAP